MILRRVIDHFRKQEWTAIFLDFVIVVVGVFVGIQVSNWNAARQDRQSERQYIEQLRQDLVLIKEAVRDQIDFEAFQSRLAIDLSNEIASPGPRSEEKILVGMAQLTMRRTLRVESATFADLQSSGNLEIIADPVLRAAIITCFFRADRFEAVIDKNNQYYADEGIRAFMSGEGLRNRAWDDALMNAKLPASVAFAENVSDRALAQVGRFPAETGILDDPGMKDMIVAQLSWRLNGSSANESIAQQLLEAVTALDEALAAHTKGSAR